MSNAETERIKITDLNKKDAKLALKVAAVGGVITVASVFGGYHGFNRALNFTAEEELPKIYSSKDIDKAKELFEEKQNEVDTTVENFDIQKYEENINSEEALNAQKILEYEKLRAKSMQKTDAVGAGFAALSAIGLVIGVPTTGFGLWAARNFTKYKNRYVEIEPKDKYKYRELLGKNLTEREIEYAVAYLPPIGGKIPYISKDKSEIVGWKLEPTRTAEEQVDIMMKLRRAGLLGEAYIHQLTVQGQLPDEFKYAALALIMNSPWEYDWDLSNNQYAWGSVAPLVHDGGVHDVKINSVWLNKPGRTDFIQRRVPVFLNNLEDVENESYKAISERSSNELKLATSEQAERERLLVEAKAFQRLALALHCYLQESPWFIPYYKKLDLGIVWLQFSLEMGKILNEIGIPEMKKDVWFYEEGRTVKGWPGLRKEGEWEPIKKNLKKLENLRKNNPSLILRVNKLLREKTEEIDRIIGLS